MKHDEPTTRSPPACSPGPCATSSRLLACFAELPSTVKKLMEQRGVTTPEKLRTSAAFMHLLEQSLDPGALKAVTTPSGDSIKVLNAVQGHLRSLSAEALAVHLYTKELLRLLSVAAARQYIAAARNR
jgi:hypothetical protein